MFCCKILDLILISLHLHIIRMITMVLGYENCHATLPSHKLCHVVHVKATEDASLWNHDWQRAARMASYGFLIYGPLSQVWYEILDHFLPLKNMTNLSIKVLRDSLTRIFL